LHTKQTEISQKQSEQTKIFKISYYIISEVLKKEMIKIIEVRGTLIMVLNMLCMEISCGFPTNYKHVYRYTISLSAWYLTEVLACVVLDWSICVLLEWSICVLHCYLNEVPARGTSILQSLKQTQKRFDTREVQRFNGFRFEFHYR
jgi:hypothetical protein